MKLIIQPEDGVEPLLSLIKGAKKRLDLTVFRFDRSDLEKVAEDGHRQGREGQFSDRLCQSRW